MPNFLFKKKELKTRFIKNYIINIKKTQKIKFNVKIIH